VSEQGTDGEEPNRVEVVIQHFFEDMLLWPVLIVAVLTVATFGAAALTSAIADRRPPAMAAVALFAGLSLYAVDSERRRRGIRHVSYLVFAIWTASALGAFILARLG
jgi:hypothetical protein